MKIEVIQLSQKQSEVDVYKIVQGMVGVPDDAICKMLIQDIVGKCVVKGLDAEQVKRAVTPITSKIAVCHRNLTDVYSYYSKM